MQNFDIKKLKPKDMNSKNLKPKKKLRKRTKVIISILLIIVVSIGVIKVFIPKKSLEVSYTILSKGDIIEKINVSGEVGSENSKNVYSTLNNIVKEINVEVGDIVKAGDILAVLDSGTLEKDIEQAVASTNATEGNYKIQYDIAKKAYNDILYINDNNLNLEITNGEAAINSTKMNLEDKQKNYEYKQLLFDYGEISNDELSKSRMDYENSKDNYDKAVVALENAKLKSNSDLDNAKASYETAKINYENKSQSIGIEKQKKQLEDCIIKAPIDGTITSVDAIVGSPGAGILFKIEDLKDVTISAKIKEVDIANVKVGQRTEIKTDSTGDSIIDGEVLSISPTAYKVGLTQIQEQSQATASDVNFESKIRINNLNENIKVGMKARVNIILAEKSNIYTVPYESIMQNDEINSIYIAEKITEKEHKYVVKEIKINTGLESDLDVEISGEGLSEGILILTDPSIYQVDQIITINGGEIVG